MYDVTIYLHAETNLYHASKALAGLYRLAEQREVRLHCQGGGFAQPHAAVLHLEVADAALDGGPARKVAIDLLDRSDLVDRAALGACDVYFKRSHYQDDLSRWKLEPSLRAKIRPWGLNFPCRVKAGAAGGWSLLWRCNWRRALQAAFRGPRAARRLFQQCRQFAALPDAAQFEVDERTPLDRVVLFQTRLWAPEETEPDDAHDVNELRVRIVRALRRAFGKAFLGGIVPTPLARRHYAGDIVPAHQARMKNYAAHGRRALIGVYSRGLHHSTAFKLPEYLAGSKVVVAQGLRNDTPAALAPEVHWASFRDADECVERCARLLGDRERCAEMRRAAGDYYRSHVEPGAHLHWTLMEALRLSGGAPIAARDRRTADTEPRHAEQRDLTLLQHN